MKAITNMKAIANKLTITPLLLGVLDLKQIDFGGLTVLDLFVMKEKTTR